MQHINGVLYGTTQNGGTYNNCPSGCGAVFRFNVGLGPFVKFVAPYGRIGSLLRFWEPD